MDPLALCVVKEMICLSYFKAEASFLSKYAPGRPLALVKIVVVGDFFDQETTREIGFPNVCFIADCFRLYDSSLRKLFGKAGYDILQNHLIRLIQASLKSEFEKIV